MLPLQAFATSVVAEVIRRQPLSAGKIAFAWTVAVGPAIARATSVDLRDGVLYVTPKDARWATEVDRATPTILKRVQVLLGADAITDLRVGRVS